MAELKTKKSDESVTEFLNTIADEDKRKDCKTVSKLMQQITKSKPKMWGATIVGFGEFHYKGKSGREGDWFKLGFSPRKQNISLYVIADLEKYKSHLSKTGKIKTSRSCIYINSLKDIDLDVFKSLCETAYKDFDKHKYFNSI